MRLPAIVMIAAAGILNACSADQDSGRDTAGRKPPIQLENPAETGIPWFKGSIEDAFAAAKAEKKPVFLYWGAQWCPPCQELKATIFRRDEFIAQSKLFVPVYLDGDTERAQKYGEQFGAQGYPTVIIFDPQGVEVTRIPGGMNIEQYLGVLELALNALRPVKDLLQAVQAGQDIRDDDWRLLASYSWNQDRGQALGEGSGYAALQTLAAACPDRLVVTKSKLQMLAIVTWAGQAERNELLAAEYGLQIERILNDPTLNRENLSVLIGGSADMLKAMAPDEQRMGIHGTITAQLATAIQDPSIGVLTRIDSLYSWVEANRVLLGANEQLTVAQQDWVKAQVAALRPQLDRYQQHAALSSISELLLNAGLMPEARTAMREGIEVSKQPYYFMSGMAYLETRAGNHDAAIAWHKKAWDAAQGPATRVQWGSSYMFALIELRPDDTDAIRLAGTTVLGELAQQKEALYQRNSGRIDRLSQTLLTWAKPAQGDTSIPNQRQAVLSSLRGEMDRLCAGIAAASEAAATCSSFLVPI